MRIASEASGPRLRHQAAAAFSWMALGRVFDRGLGVLRIVVLARLLAPDDFGTFGIALLALGALEKVTRPGLGLALIQRKGDVDRYLSPAWTLLSIRGWLLALVLFLSRHPIAAFFNDPEVSHLLAWVALATGIGGLTSVGLDLLQRDLRLSRRFLVMSVATTADFLVAIPAAWILRDAVALAYGMLARNIILVILSFLVYPFRPRITFRWRPLVDLRSFAAHGTFHSLVLFVLDQGDDAFVGKTLGTANLGLYVLAYRVANLLTQEISRILMDVAIPLFSRVQDNRARLSEGFREVLGIIGTLSIPAVVFLSLAGEPFIRFFLGSQWVEGTGVFRILLLFGLSRAFTHVCQSLLTARGEMAHISRVMLLQLLLMVGAVIFMGLRFGLLGVGWAIFLPQSLTFFLFLRRVSSSLEASVWKLVRGLRGSVSGSLIGGFAAATALNIFQFGDTPDSLLLLGAFGFFFPMFFLGSWPFLKRDLAGTTGFLSEIRSEGFFKDGKK